jgi:hypothetical protein
MKRILLFLLFLALGTAGLWKAAGGLHVRRTSLPSPTLPVTGPQPADAPSLAPGSGIPDIQVGSGITQMAPPRRVVWHDPLSDDSIVIESFFPWRFKTRDFQPLPTADGAQQGVLCSDVVFELYREPATRAEALALRDGAGRQAYRALLHQRFRALEARVYGRLGEALARSQKKDAAAQALGDTMLRFSGGLEIEDRVQAIAIHGGEGTALTVWPEQGRAEGRGPFVLDHEALSIHGSGLVMERDRARGYDRIAILRNPVLRLRSEGRDASGRPLFDFGPGAFHPATVSSDGRVIVVREETRHESRVKITFTDAVRGEQEGGRSLDAGRAELLAVRPLEGAAGLEGRWRLRWFHAGGGVVAQVPGRTRNGEAYIASVSAQRLQHDVQEGTDGAPPRATTLFEGDPVIQMRGEISLLGPGGRLRASCRDRAWIGPLPAGAADGGLPRDALRQLSLRGQARIEREDADASRGEDVVEGDAIDLVVWPPSRTRGPATKPGGPGFVAVTFAAVGDVRMASANVRGSTGRLVAEGLQTERPHVTAEGRGTHFAFRHLGRHQRLLGSDTREARAPQPEEPARRWVLQRLLASGAVDIDTSLGGPALGIPAHLSGDEVSYDGVSNRAQARASGGLPVRVSWQAGPGQQNHMEMRELGLERASGRLWARGGVQGELYVRRTGGGRSPFDLGAGHDVGPHLQGAVLTVRTDEHVDIDLVRRGLSTTLAPDQEQTVRIAGPVTTELRAADQVVDRMRSQSLEVVLAYRERPARGAWPALPTARAADGRSGAGEARPAPASGPLDKIEVHAHALHVEAARGTLGYLEADGAVDLASAEGHVTGARLTYDASRHRAEVHGGDGQPARALLGGRHERSEVTGDVLWVDLAGGRPVRLEAHAPRGGRSDVQLYRQDPRRQGQTEWFAVTYEGALVMTDTSLTSGRVRVVRRLRPAGATSYEDPVVLHAPTLRATGRNLLSDREAARVITTIVAEGRGHGRGSEVDFESGRGADRTRVWAHRFVFDVPAQQAVLTGLPGRDVLIARGKSVLTYHVKLRVDLAHSLPTYSEGSRILWHPDDGR